PKKLRNYSKKELKEIYARSRREFTAADLQKYTVIEKGVPLEKIIAEMEAIHRKGIARNTIPIKKVSSTARGGGSKSMANRKDDKSKRRMNKEERELQAMYAKSRAEFTAADLQKFTEIDEGIPARQVLAQLEEAQRRYARKSK